MKLKFINGGSYNIGKLLKQFMRAFIFLYCSIMFALGPNNGFSQNAIIKIKTDKIMTIKQVFNLVNKQTDYKFIYRQDLIENAIAPNLFVKKGTIKASELLDKCLFPNNFTYVFSENNTIMVKKNSEASIIQNSKIEDEEQQKEISGKVTDTDGMPLPGASIIVKGTSKGTTTNFDGNFTMSISKEVTTIVVSFMGFATQEIVVGVNQEILTIKLVPSASSLEEVIIVGYGSQKKGDLTGAISSVRSEELTKIATTDLGKALQGRVAGVQVTQASGEPGSGTTVKIRGVGSILSNNEPLVLINGFQGALDDVDADNVESITVLKDAAAASIYGSRAANGVILITTKKGRVGHLDVTFKTEVGVQSIGHSQDYLSASDWASRQNEGRSNIGMDPFWTAETMLPENITGGTDWEDFVFKNALMVDSHLGISGGTETTKYAVGIGYTSQEGIVIGTDFDRFNIRMDVEQKIGKSVKVGANLSASRSNYESSLEMYDNAGRGALNLIAGAPATLPAYTSDGRVTYPRFPGEEYSVERYISPALVSNIQDNTERINKVTANVFVEVDVFEGFKYKLALNASEKNTYGKDLDKYFEVTAADDPTIVKLTGSPAVLNRSSGLQEFWEVQNIFTYNKSFGEHNLSALLGFSAQENKELVTSATGQGLPSDDIQSLGAAENMISMNSTSYTMSLASQFARLTYSYDGKYLFQANVRRDGTSVFAPGNNYATFPSFSAGWKISEEDFLKNNEVISNLKIRYGYGSLGNAQIPAFAWISTITVDETTAIGESQTSVPAYSISDLTNEDVQWETTTSSNLGLDFSLFDNKLNFVGDFYNKRTTDMLLEVPIAQSSGFVTGPVVNIGEVQNRGWEAMVSYNDTFGDVKFGASFNISRVNNEVISLGDTEAYTDGPLRVEEGKSLFAYWGYETDGVWETYDQIANNASQASDLPGKLRYKDLNGYDPDGNLTGTPDGIINDADKKELGSNIPDYVYGFNLSAEYKNFDLSVLFSGESNKDMAISAIFGGLGGDKDGGINTNVDQSVYDNRTILNADGNVATAGDYPAIGYTPLTGEWSDFNIKDVSYLRISNIQLGYTLSDKVTEKLGISSVRLYMSLTNPVLWTNYVGYDPEFKGLTNNGDDKLDSNTGLTSSGGIDAYPKAKNTAFGIKVSF